jgi:hypothetical protein
MPTALLSVLALLGAPGGEPAAGRLLPLTESLAPARLPALPQGVNYDREPPLGWVSAGIFFTSSEVELPPPAGSPDEDEPLGIEFGFYTWKNNEMGVGLEFAAIHSEYKVDVTSIESESVDVWRGMVGLRLADAGINPLFTPFARAGAVWRQDKGTLLDDSGVGYYLGAGLDWRLAGGLALTPSLLYQDSNSFDAREWLFGLSLTLQF